MLEPLLKFKPDKVFYAGEFTGLPDSFWSYSISSHVELHHIIDIIECMYL